MEVINLFNVDGSSYAMVNLNIKGKEIDDLSDVLRAFQHIRYLDIS